MKNPPSSINFGYTFREKDLWAIDAEVEEMSLEALRHNLDIPYLDKDGTDDWNLTPRELIAAPAAQPGHRAKIQACDLSYPIEIYEFQGSWKILDGVHRFCKAYMEKKNIIRVRKITEAQLAGISRS